MKQEINPQETSRAEAFELWMTSPMPMVTLTKTFNVSNIATTQIMLTNCLINVFIIVFPPILKIQDLRL